MEALGAAATVVQLVSFTGDVFLKGYSFLSKVQKAPSEIRLLMREVAHPNALLDQLQAISGGLPHIIIDAGDDKSEIRNALHTLDELGVFEECSRLMHVIEKSLKAWEQVKGHELSNFGKKLIWPFKEKETKDTMMQLGRLRETLSAAVVVDSARGLKEMQSLARNIDSDGITELQLASQKATDGLDYVKDILEYQMEIEERLAIRTWLHPDGINADASYTAALATKLSDTGQWLLGSKDFASWRANSHGCMSIYGIAGCGKTILSATVIDHLLQDSNPQSCVLYFFSDHRNPAMQSIQDLLHVLIQQLLDQNPACFEDAKYWHEKSLRRVAGPHSIAAKPLSVSEYVTLIKQMCLKWESVSLVIDALDECSDLDSFIGGLKGILEGPNLRLLLTSRHGINIKRIMEPLANFSISMMEQMGDDIEIYLRAEIHRRVALGKFKFKQKGLDSLVVAELIAKADGMTLIAKLQLDYICGLRSDRAIKEALVELPSGIFATYDEILSQLCTRYPDDIHYMKRILQWLAFSMEPLSLQQLAEIVSLRPEDRTLDESGIPTDLTDLAACCGSLVTVNTQDTSSGQYEDLRGPEVTLITLAHASVEEYLTSGKVGKGLSSIFHMDAKAVHLELAKICLQYVGLEDFEKPLEQPASSSNHKHPTIAYAYFGAKYAMVDYASLHWSAHLRQSHFTESPDEGTISLLNWFINSDDYPGNYRSWQQMYHHDVIWFCTDRPACFYAIEFKIDNLVKLLLPSDLDNIHSDKWAQTPLHVAARCGSFSIVQDLVWRGASIELKSGINARAMTALHFAAEGGRAEVIKFLLQAGASPNSRSMSQATPFYRAARSGSLKALRILYDAGSDINARTWDSFTPLFEAVAHGRSRTAGQLLEWGADPSITTANGESALKLLIRAGNVKRKKIGDLVVTGDDVLNDIIRIRSAGTGFADYLKDLKAQYVLAMGIEFDSTPGPEREKDYRWSKDPSKIVPMSEYRDRDD